jgi:2-amino-4-hydroxy-6-hydroxymethyldihydropteridine diphosphokinase
VRDEVTAYVGVGANLGEARQAVERAIDDLGRLPSTRLLARSSPYRTAPVDASGPDYVNAVAAIGTRLTAPDLLAQLQALEQRAGRERPWRNAPRTLDLDLLLYGAARIDSPALTVPHPRWLERAFVLVPLAEIAPAIVDPAALRGVTSQVIARIP